MVNKNMYDNEPWAALVRECGLEPTDTEMQARTVARHAILREYKKMGYRVVSPYASRGEGK